MKNLILLISFLFLLQVQSNAQQNYLFTNYSYTFFGTGDLSGTALGIDYHRTLWKRFGLHVGFSKASGGGDFFFKMENFNDATVRNARITGNKGLVNDLGTYETYLLGVNYKVNDGNKHVLLTSIGLNYKRLKYIGIDGAKFENNSTLVTINGNFFNSTQEFGLYAGFDYLYFINDAISIGLHLAIEGSGNILSKVGVSLGYRFGKEKVGGLNKP